VNGAGTDAKVFLTMNGDKNKVMKYQLQKPEGGKNAFEKGNKDVFKFNEADVGRVCSFLRHARYQWVTIHHSFKQSILNTMVPVSVLDGSSTRSK
jgi:lipoxygenase homology domain-containing protein 1